jgi:hypothetical protein
MKSTQQKAFFVLLITLTSVGILGVMLFITTQMGEQLMERITAIETAHKKQLAYKELKATYERTDALRTELSGFALTEEQAADFLTKVEAVGVQQGIGITTNNIKIEKKKDTPDMLLVQFSIEGSETNVRKTIELFEQLPYRSYLSSIVLTRSESEYKATVDVAVILLRYET